MKYRPSHRALALAAALAGGLAAGALAAGDLVAQEAPSYALGGSVEERPFARCTGSGGLDAAGLSYGQSTSLGLELTAKGEIARAAASIEAALLSGTAASDAWAAAGAASALGLDTAGLLFAPAYDETAPAPRTLLEARIRALYVKLDYDRFSLTAGRQVVKYRRGALWSPTDPFTELDLSGISPVRRGSDALRLVLPLGAAGAFDLVAAPTAGFAEGRYAARLAGLLAGVDCAALAYREGAAGSWNIGGDFKADLGISLDGAALYSKPDSSAGFIRASGGADYSFGDFLVAAEYYYNGGGAAADANAPGSHNVYVALSWSATDFLTVAASLIDGLSAGSWVSALTASLDAAQNAAVAAYARLGHAGSSAAGPWTAESGLSLSVKF